MPDSTWWSSAGATPAHVQSRRLRERLWTVTKNGKRIDAELMFHAEYGVEIQFLPTRCDDRRAEERDCCALSAERCRESRYFSTFNVTSTLVTSPFILSVASVNWVVCPSFMMTVLTDENLLKLGCPPAILTVLPAN
jgi:hypothetical protein